MAFQEDVGKRRRKLDEAIGHGPLDREIREFVRGLDVAKCREFLQKADNTAKRTLVAAPPYLSGVGRGPHERVKGGEYLQAMHRGEMRQLEAIASAVMDERRRELLVG
jgi:hypothetical protein